jgi:LDH2 family malate/lactate/ureidoglycolate dehydrogenase
VRLPGERGLKRLEAQLREGVAIKPAVVTALSSIGAKLGVSRPKPL